MIQFGILRTWPLVLLATSGCAIAEDIIPAMAPIPRMAPALPVPEDESKLSDTERLLRRLGREIRARDTAIAELARTAPGMRPAAGATEDPGLREPRQQRDKARDALAAALAEYAGRASKTSGDPLDVARPAAQDRQAATLSAANRLAIADCHRELALQGGPDAEIDAGLAELDAIEPSALPESDRAQILYLRTWFLCERAKRAQGPAQAHAIAQARASLAEFERQWPASDLLTAARAVVALLPAPPTEGAP
jgi:hypothetical protein